MQFGRLQCQHRELRRGSALPPDTSGEIIGCLWVRLHFQHLPKDVCGRSLLDSGRGCWNVLPGICARYLTDPLTFPDQEYPNFSNVIVFPDSASFETEFRKV